MIAYNTSIKIDWSILEEWLVWQLDKQIPAMLATGFFDDFKMYRLLEQDDTDGPGFTIQFFTTDTERYRLYNEGFASLFRQETANKWGDKCITFHTVMELVETE
ncbi:MAG: DUF4286 family protein [Puia sp.]|nr:DUF4286 family protein [Puia sp.]